MSVDEAQFRAMLRLGLGRGILYARSHDVSEFRDVILDACLHCGVYDVQFEGTRGAYMYDLVSCLPDKEFYFDEVLRSLKESGDDYDAVQRFHFAACMASEGSDAAKRAMYAAYDPGPDEGELIGTDFLEDGMNGLLFVAEKLGALFAVQPQAYRGYLLRQAIEIIGEQETWEALEQAAATNANVATYLSFAREASRARTAEPSQAPAIASLSYQQLMGKGR